MQEALREKIDELVRSYFASERKEEFVPGKTRVPLVVPQFGADEVIESIHSLLSTYVTMGAKVRQFESMFAKYIGMRAAVMVNSGSSAILLALSALSSPRYRDRIGPDSEVICPAVTWPTTVNPVFNVGATPVLVDVDLDNLGMKADQVQEAITKKTRAVVAVHLMGNPCEVDKIRTITESKDLHLLEDACEAHGATIAGKRVGSFGRCSAFSFYISHHITTIEGGIVLSDDAEFLEIATSQRAHGWVREMRDSQQIASRYPQIDSRFLFYETGYNLRPTEIQGAFGIHQLPKLDGLIEMRRKIAKAWNRRLAGFRDLVILPEERPQTMNSYFAYPIVIKAEAPFTRKDIVDFLTGKLIDTRPVAGGNLSEQPSSKLYRHRIVGRLENARLIMRNAFFIGLHAGIGEAQQEYVAGSLEEFLSAKSRR